MKTKIVTADNSTYPELVTIEHVLNAGMLFPYVVRYRGTRRFNTLHRNYRQALYSAQSKERYEKYEAYMQDLLIETIKD